MSEQKNQQKQPPKRATSGIFAILMALLLFLLGQQGILPLGWDSSQNYVSDVAPGYSIGGDRFGNYEGLLPDASGRKWYEADANYTAGPRGAERILYSSDGLVYYTNDHYQTFTEMHPSGK